MKVLFLDIDGVLNSFKTAKEHKGFPLNFTDLHLKRFDWDAVKRVKDICRRTGTQIVLSSSWRRYFTFEEVGQHLDLDIIDATVTLSSFIEGRRIVRGDEIQEWLDRHPEVTQWAIVDDDCDMLDSQMDRFVNTCIDDGLTEEDAKALEALLS